MNSPTRCGTGPLGPLETSRWPDTLTARVITPGDEPQVRGYDVESDLAHHYRSSELLLLALTAQLPSAESALAFEVAQIFLAPVSVAHASTHAAVLARICGARPSAIIAVAAGALAEQAREELADHEELLRALSMKADIPPRFIAVTDSELAASERLRLALGRVGFLLPGAAPLKRMAGLVCVCVACGLSRREQIEAAIVQTRLGPTVAEAFAEHKANFSHYPANLPRFSYEEAP